MIIGLKMWPLEWTQGKKLMTDDAQQTQHYHSSTLSTKCSGELTIKMQEAIVLLSGIQQNKQKLFWHFIQKASVPVILQISFLNMLSHADDWLIEWCLRRF